jgi:CheY-like chemotaxis protein
MANERILLVDDNAVNLKVTSALLSRESYEVVTATSAEQALGMLQSFHPHLILSDIFLTGMDGLELARRVKATPEWRTIPLIALTGMHSPEEEHQALAAGFHAFLTKPVAPQVLRDTVRKHLGAVPDTSAELSLEDLIAPLRAQFLSMGAEKCRRLLATLPAAAAPPFDHRDLRSAFHSWAGAGGTVGFPRVTEKAREGEALLDRPFQQIASQLRGVMENLLEQFTNSSVGGELHTTEVQPVAATGASARKPMVLICDDDPVVRGVIQSTLEASGMVCRTADNGHLACAMALTDPFDAIVLDIDMPALDGFQVLDELRRVETTSRLKVMILTARDETADITRGVCHGADDYMIKPFAPAVLVERLKELLAAPVPI